MDILEHDIYAMSVPITLVWSKIRLLHPYFGIEGIYNFYNKTKYKLANVDKINVADLELNIIGGVQININNKFSFRGTYVLPPTLGRGKESTISSTGLRFSLSYELN